MKIRKAINIIEFITHFPDQESCEIFLKTYRENSGIYCKTCNCFLNSTGIAEVSFLSEVNAGEGLLSRRGQ